MVCPGGASAPTPRVDIFPPSSPNSPLRSTVVARSTSDPAVFRVSYEPSEAGVHRVVLDGNGGGGNDYPVRVSHPAAVSVTRGYDAAAGDFVPPLVVGEEAVVSLYTGEAGPGKIEAEWVARGGQERRKAEVAGDDM